MRKRGLGFAAHHVAGIAHSRKGEPMVLLHIAAHLACTTPALAALHATRRTCMPVVTCLVCNLLYCTRT